MAQVLIPASIRDPVLRRTLEEIARNLGGGGAVSTQTNDPTTDSNRGSDGDIIYATGSESIWVFTGSQWERASSGAEGVTVECRAYTEASVTANLNDSSQWVPLGNVIKNDDDQTSRVLAVHVFEGGVEISNTRYSGASYVWRKNLTIYTPVRTQPSFAGNNTRFLAIDGRDVADGGSDVFVCTVDYT